MQTISPVDYQGEEVEKWKRINSYILTELNANVDFVFYNTVIIGKKGILSEAIYGGHPNEIGCEIWANALFEKIQQQIIF